MLGKTEMSENCKEIYGRNRELGKKNHSQLIGRHCVTSQYQISHFVPGQAAIWSEVQLHIKKNGETIQWNISVRHILGLFEGIPIPPKDTQG